jgi:hypothetical protein
VSILIFMPPPNYFGGTASPWLLGGGFLPVDSTVFVVVVVVVPPGPLTVSFVVALFWRSQPAKAAALSAKNNISIRTMIHSPWFGKSGGVSSLAPHRRPRSKQL